MMLDSRELIIQAVFPIKVQGVVQIQDGPLSHQEARDSRSHKHRPIGHFPRRSRFPAVSQNLGRLFLVSCWDNLDGPIKKPPVATSIWSSSRLDIFAIGSGDRMYHKWWDGSKWTPQWEDVGTGTFSSCKAILRACLLEPPVFSLQNMFWLYRLT